MHPITLVCISSPFSRHPFLHAQTNFIKPNQSTSSQMYSYLLTHFISCLKSYPQLVIVIHFTINWFPWYSPGIPKHPQFPLMYTPWATCNMSPSFTVFQTAHRWWLTNSPGYRYWYISLAFHYPPIPPAITFLCIPGLLHPNTIAPQGHSACWFLAKHILPSVSYCPPNPLSSPVSSISKSAKLS